MNLSSYISQFKAWYIKMMSQAREQIIPGVSLLVSRSRKYVQFFKRTPTEKKGKYIRAKDVETEIRPLAQSMYAKNLLRILDKNLQKINQIEEIQESLSSAYTDLPEEVKPFVTPYILTNLEYQKWWEAQLYATSQYPKKEKHTTLRGEEVRSKSEEMIANALFQAGIPYRYEAELILKERTVYPDFTILIVQKQKEIILEHFGMMKDAKYYSDANAKIKMYQENGYFWGVNLLVTVEFENDDLDSKIIQNLIEAIQRM